MYRVYLSSERQIPFKMAAKHAEKLGMHYIETSSVTGINVDEVFITISSEILKHEMAEKSNSSPGITI